MYFLRSGLYWNFYSKNPLDAASLEIRFLIKTQCILKLKWLSSILGSPESLFISSGVSIYPLGITILRGMCILKILLLLRCCWLKTIWLGWKEACWQICLTFCPRSWWGYRKRGGSTPSPCWPSGSGGCERPKRAVGGRWSKGASRRRTRYLRRQVGAADV